MRGACRVLLARARPISIAPERDVLVNTRKLRLGRQIDAVSRGGDQVIEAQPPAAGAAVHSTVAGERDGNDGPRISLTPEERIVYGALADPLTRDALIRAAGLPPHEALALIGMLELKGIIKEEFGAWRRA